MVLESTFDDNNKNKIVRFKSSLIDLKKISSSKSLNHKTFCIVTGTYLELYANGDILLILICPSV